MSDDARLGVWVAIAVTVRGVVVNARASTEPITGGKMGIFNRPEPEVQEQLYAEVIGVFSDKWYADAAVMRHQAVFADLEADYQVTSHEVEG